MKARLAEHCLSIIVVALLFAVGLSWYQGKQARIRAVRDSDLAPYLSLQDVDLTSAFDRELFRESVEAYYPSSPQRADSLLVAIDQYRAERFTRQEYKSGVHQLMTADDLIRLGLMAMQFVAVYLVAIVITALCGRSLAIYRFVRAKQRRAPGISRVWEVITRTGKRLSPRSWATLASTVGAGLLTFLMFTPAYVVAYAFKARVEGSSLLFLILLAVLTNGMLASYAARFFTMLMAESRKGYVETAAVKNLHTAWQWEARGGVPYAVLWRPSSAATDHIFHHIYLEASYVHVPALKEHASFLLTGLIIIEMALNIQGHLGYELLRNILYRRYDLVACIVFGMFLLVKLTEIAVDGWMHRLNRRYDNAA